MPEYYTGDRMCHAASKTQPGTVPSAGNAIHEIMYASSQLTKWMYGKNEGGGIRLMNFAVGRSLKLLQLINQEKRILYCVQLQLAHQSFKQMA